MATPIRIEYAGALYRATLNHNRREAIRVNNANRIDWLDVPACTCVRFIWGMRIFCYRSG